MGDVIEGIFGGGPEDKSAQEIANAQLEAQKSASAQEQARWQAENDRVTKDKAAAQEQATQDEAKRKADLDASRVENQKQIEAQGATGQGIQFDQTMAAKKLAAADAGGIQLPNFQSLSKFAATTPGGYQGQTNTLVSPAGFNRAQVGGRRYA